MGFLSRLMGRETRTGDVSSERRSQPTSWDLLGRLGVPTATGVPVNPAVVEGNAAAFAAVQLIAEQIATLPLMVYRRVDNGVREEESRHPVARLFRNGPNELQTPSEFVCMMQANCLLHGHAYAEIIRDGAGRPEALWPLHPGQISVLHHPGTRRLIYEVSDHVSSRRLLPGEVLAIRDRWDDAFTPRSRLDRVREALGGAVATERFAASIWKNGAKPSGIITHPDELGSEAAKTLRESLENLYSGSENAGRIGILEENMQWQNVATTPHDAELTAARQQAVLEVSRIFNVPAPLLADMRDANFSNVQEMRRQFASGTIQPWLVKWEQAILRDLFSEESRRAHEVEFDTDLLVRSDMLTRLQAYRIGRETGLYSANDLRRFESLNPREDAEAETFLSPMNMQSEQTGSQQDNE